LLIDDRQSRRVIRAEQRGWMRGLMATQARRSTVVTLALFLSLVIQLMNLLDVFDGASTGLWIAVFTIQILLLAVVIIVPVVGMRERGTRPRR